MTKLNRKIKIPQDCRPVPGYEGIYVISQTGEVYDLRLKRAKVVYLNKMGYAYVNLQKDGKMKSHYNHRLLMLVWHPVENCENLEVNHIDGQKWNYTPSNLEWVTHRENIIHAHRVLNAWGYRKTDNIPE